jgi:hypothetical protein
VKKERPRFREGAGPKAPAGWGLLHAGAPLDRNPKPIARPSLELVAAGFCGLTAPARLPHLRPLSSVPYLACCSDL